VQPIPYLFFRGDAAEALAAYAAVFRSDPPEIMRMSDAPGGASYGEPHHVMHGSVRVGTGWLYASDSNDPSDRGGAVAVTSATPEETRRLFAALAEGGSVQIPVEATFWSPAFGMCIDRWGTRWMLDTDRPPAADRPAAGS
jgi:PhnB protein